jgi:hypothetical protein
MPASPPAKVLPQGLAAKPGPMGDLALTLPVFLAYQVGVVFLDVRNASDLVTSRLLALSHGDRWTYFGLTGAIATVMVTVLGVMGRGQVLRLRKLVQIAVEGAAYALAMGAATSWVIGSLFVGPSARSVGGPFPGIVLSLGAGFYEEVAFRVVLFGLGSTLLLWLFGAARLRHQGSGGRGLGLGLAVLAVKVPWAIVCAAMFSGMHYIGPLGDVFDVRSFVARLVLGLALTVVFVVRGFSAAVWTHALYDVWVLVLGGP